MMNFRCLNTKNNRNNENYYTLIILMISMEIHGTELNFVITNKTGINYVFYKIIYISKFIIKTK